MNRLAIREFYGCEGRSLFLPRRLQKTLLAEAREESEAFQLVLHRILDLGKTHLGLRAAYSFSSSSQTAAAEVTSMLVWVRGFGITHASLFPESTLTAGSCAAIGDAVKQLTKYTGSKGMATRGSVKTKTAARLAPRNVVVANRRRMIPGPGEGDPGQAHSLCEERRTAGARTCSWDGQRTSRDWHTGLVRRTNIHVPDDKGGVGEGGCHQKDIRHPRLPDRWLHMVEGLAARHSAVVPSHASDRRQGDSPGLTREPQATRSY